jgi:hypothetical protein
VVTAAIPQVLDRIALQQVEVAVVEQVPLQPLALEDQGLAETSI